MCNRVHRENEDFREIPPEGVAYKIFKVYTTRVKGCLVVKETALNTTEHTSDKGNWIDWWFDSYRQDSGFCFFPTFDAAVDVAKSWVDCTGDRVLIRACKYREGLGSFSSKEFDGTERQFLIAKSFKKCNLLAYVFECYDEKVALVERR